MGPVNVAGGADVPKSCPMRSSGMACFNGPTWRRLLALTPPLLEFWVVRVLWWTSRRRDFVGENGERPGVRRGGGRSRCPHQLKGVLEAAGVAFVEESGGGAGVRLKNDPAPSAIRSRA